MSALRKVLTSPRTWLVIVAVAGGALVVDAQRTPSRQFTARAYVCCVELYQQHVRGSLEGHVACRFTPSCSDYSIVAVRRQGIARGLALTAKRISQCRESLPANTCDPVPTLTEPPLANAARPH